MTKMAKVLKNQPDEDYQLINAFLGADLQAFDSLLLKYKNPIYHLCFQMIGNAQDAEDCAQETFIKAYRNLIKFKFESAFATWLYRIAVNTCKNKLASAEYRAGKRFVRIDKPFNSEEGVCRVEIPDQISPDVTFERKEILLSIIKAVGTLPYDQKVLIVLRDFEGRSYEEIAKITGKKMGTIKSKLARAREALRLKLKGVIQG